LRLVELDPNRPHVFRAHLELACRLQLTTLDAASLPDTGDEQLKIGIFHFKSSSTIRLSNVNSTLERLRGRKSPSKDLKDNKDFKNRISISLRTLLSLASLASLLSFCRTGS